VYFPTNLPNQSSTVCFERRFGFFPRVFYFIHYLYPLISLAPGFVFFFLRSRFPFESIIVVVSDSTAPLKRVLFRGEDTHIVTPVSIVPSGVKRRAPFCCPRQRPAFYWPYQTTTKKPLARRQQQQQQQQQENNPMNVI